MKINSERLRRDIIPLLFWTLGFSQLGLISVAHSNDEFRFFWDEKVECLGLAEISEFVIT